jgi:hypothetical protein
VVDAAHVGERFKDVSPFLCLTLFLTTRYGLQTPYDFVASSNVFEHLVNPLSVMKQVGSLREVLLVCSG